MSVAAEPGSEDEKALSELRLIAEMERLKADRATLAQLRSDIENGTETKRSIGLFLLGAAIALGMAWAISLMF